MKMVGGTGIIGQDMVCGFKKDNGIIVFDKWEEGDWDNGTGKAIQNSKRVRTPWVYRKKVKPNTTYEFNTNILTGTRLYRKNGTYIGNLAHGTGKIKLITTSNSYYLLLIMETSNRNLKVTIKEVS